MPLLWQFTVTCKDCGERINIGLAPSPAEVGEPSHEDVEVGCPYCSANHPYVGEEVRRALVDLPSP